MSRMDAAEEPFMTEGLRQKIAEVNVVAKKQLAGVQDHINFTLQQACFKCAYECFDRKRNHGEITYCVDHCRAPVIKAQDLVKREMAKFQDRLNRSLADCQEKYEAAKLRPGSRNDWESCVDVSVGENIKLIPHAVVNLNAYLDIQG